MLHIDGSHGEGGGQVLRNTLVLSAITGRPACIKKIRAGRPRPGLRPQHLAAVRAAASVCNARVTGDLIGSLEITFVPGRVRSGRFRFDIGTAGAATLVLQTILVPLSIAGKTSHVTITGGTHVPYSPCFHYLRDVFGAAVSSMGFDATFRIKKWGWYPKGGGEIEAEIGPAREIRPFNAVQVGAVPQVFALSASSGLPAHVRRRQHQRVKELLMERGIELNVKEYEPHSPDPGSLVFLWVNTNGRWGGFAALGARGKPAEQVAEEAVSGLFDFFDSNTCVDTRLADQLISPALIASGTSLYTVPRISRHLETCEWIIEQFGLKAVSLKSRPVPLVAIHGSPGLIPGSG